jgi:S-adenosylmethionine decarboxylase
MMDGLTALGITSLMPSGTQPGDHCVSPGPPDHFAQRDGERFAGTHLIIDLWGASGLADPAHIDTVLRDAALATGATILHGHFHHFSPNGGVSGVLLLAESHLSIHTWPERDYAALDIFVCGACDAHRAVPVLRAGFAARRVALAEHRRGRLG